MDQADTIFQKCKKLNKCIELDIDDYGYKNDDFYFYVKCYQDIKKLKSSRFDFAFGSNTYKCQNCLKVNKNLGLMEKAVIVRT